MNDEHLCIRCDDLCAVAKLAAREGVTMTVTSCPRHTIGPAASILSGLDVDLRRELIGCCTARRFHERRFNRLIDGHHLGAMIGVLRREVYDAFGRVHAQRRQAKRDQDRAEFTAWKRRRDGDDPTGLN